MPGTRNDDISLILAKAIKEGFFPEVKDWEVDILSKEAKAIFNGDYSLGDHQSKLGSRVAFMGDSITAAAWGPDTKYRGESYPLYAEFFGGGKYTAVCNAGIGGERAAQMDARFNEYMAPSKPNVIVIMAGRNDIGNNTPFASYQASMISMVDKTKAMGAIPVLGTVPPSNDTLAIKAIAIKYNAWLRAYASQEAIILLDFYKALVDPINGDYKAALNSGDGIHPSSAGYRTMGQLTADVLGPVVRTTSPYLSVDNNDSFNMYSTGITPNAILNNDTNADGIPDGWSAYGGAAGFAHALVTDAAIPGKLMQVTQTANGSVRVLTRSNINVGTGFSVGDRIAVAGIVTTDGGVTANVKLTMGGLNWQAMAYKGPVTRGFFCQEIIVPAGTTAIQSDYIVGAGTGVVAFGQPTLVNLTALGI